jgi:hypothetical protein
VAVTIVQNVTATFELDGTDYSCQFLSLTLTTETSGEGDPEYVLCGEQLPGTLRFTDRITGTMIQDWPAPGGGLIGHTRQSANRGKVVPFTLTGTTGGKTVTATGKVQLTPLPLGFDPNGRAEADVSWRVTELAETYPAATP